MTKICNSISNPVPGSSLRISKIHVQPPFVGLEPLKRQKDSIETACRPPVCLSAGEEAGATNGDVTVPCVNDRADAFGQLPENKVDYSNLTCLNEFSKPNNHLHAMYEVKNSRNDFTVSKSESCTPNGDGSNGVENIFTFVSEGGVTVNVYDACANGTCKCSHLIGGEQAQLKPCRFLYMYSLATNEGKSIYKNLMSSIVDGVKVMDGSEQKENISYDCKNYKSIFEGNNKSKLDGIIDSELSEGYLKIVNNKPDCIHSIGAVPKPDGGVRPIIDCSRPDKKSVNNYCSGIEETFTFKSVENVLALLQPQDFMAVIDIKSAYRAVSIHPDNKKYMGLRREIQNKEVFIEDSRLCFGLSLGPMIFNSISNFVYSILTDIYNLQTVNYLDDFLVLGHTKEEAQLAQNIVIKILRYLGFYISWAKVTPPSQICRYLGLDIDSIEMELRLPKDKLEKLILSVNTFKDKSSISKKELESLGGLLSHCSHVVDGGRTHSRRFYDLYKVILNNNLKRIKLGLAAKEDLKWWANFAKTFNGKKKMIYPEYELPLVSDSSLKGFAIYKGEEWLAGSWDDSLKLDNDKCNHIISSPSFDDYDKTNINELELWPIISGLRVWYPDLKGKSVSIFTDNTQVYHMVRKGTSSNKTCMQWLREIFWICKIYKIRLVPYYINTKNNLVADTLSRLLYIKGESEAKKCLNGTGLCCLQKIFDCCRKPGQESGVAS